MAKATITSKGQTTVPKEIREHLNLRSGDSMEFIILDNGTVMVQPAYLDVETLSGILDDKTEQRVSIDEMNRTIGERFSKN